MTFLEQLQESAGLLNNKIKETDTTQIKNLFGNYDPTLASDYVGGPMGLIPQNRFVGNQFQMPFPGGQSYTPGAMAPGGYNPLPYTPLPFNQGNVSTTQPGLLSQIEQAVSGGRGDGREGNQPSGFRQEVIGDRSFSINNVTGEVTETTGTPTGKFAQFASGLLNLGPLTQGLNLLGANINPTEDYAQVAGFFDRYQDQFGQGAAIDARTQMFGDRTPQTQQGVGGSGSGAVGSTGPTARETQTDKAKRQEREKVAKAAKDRENRGGGYQGGGATGSGGGVGGQGMRGGAPGARG